MTSHHIGRGFPEAACLLLLLVAVGRLFALDRTEIERVWAAEARDAAWPAFGSLVGTDATGGVRRPLVQATHTLVFPIGAKGLRSEVLYWNDVVNEVRAISGAIDAWGVCDAGGACASWQSEAQFVIIAYLDPYEMRIVARSMHLREILLYDSNQVLVASLRQLDDRAAMARSIQASLR